METQDELFNEYLNAKQRIEEGNETERDYQIVASWESEMPPRKRL